MSSIVIIDANAAMRLASNDEFQRFAGYDLCAPRLFWAECCNALHRAMRRRSGGDGPELESHERIIRAPIMPIDGYERRAPWDIASILGWHKTYDAEYLAAARHTGAGILTLDQQLADGARRLGIPLVVPQ